MKDITPRQRLGSRLRTMRKRANLTQREVSEILSLSCPQFISNFERGICYPPDDTLPLLAEMFDRPARELIAITYSARMQELLRNQKDLLRSCVNA